MKRSNRVFILFLVGIVFHGITYGQDVPNEAAPPDTVVNDTRKNPGQAGSFMQVYTADGWCDDLTNNFDPQKPTLVLVHGWRMGNLNADGNFISLTLDDYWKYATRALANRVNRPGRTGDINLLGWNWVKTASTLPLNLGGKYSVVVPLDAAYNEGLLLARKLRDLSPAGKIHLLGHSLGAKVAGVAGSFLSDLPLDQVTFMDAPELETGDTSLKNIVDTAPVILEKNIQDLLAKNIYVENYSSGFGKPYAPEGYRITDIDMMPDMGFLSLVKQLIDAHGYPIAWYFGGATDMVGNPAGTLDPVTGDVSRPMGAAWSHVLNRMDSADSIEQQRKYYTLGPNLANPAAGCQFLPFDWSANPYTLVPIAVVNPTIQPATMKVDFGMNDSVRWFRQGNVVFSSTETGSRAVLTSGPPAYLFADIPVPEGKVVLSFDFKLVDPSPSDKFSVYMGDGLLMRLEGAAFPQIDGGGPINLGSMSVGKKAGKTGTLVFCWTSNESGKVAEISNLRLVSQPLLQIFELRTQVNGNNGTVFPKRRFLVTGSKVTLTAVPDPGFSVSKWINTLDDASTENTNTVLMDAAKVIGLDFRNPPCFGSGLLLIVLIGFSYKLKLTVF